MDRITPLKRLLFERQMTVKELSDRCGVNYNNLALVVNGKRLPTLENALRIARAVGEPVENLWGYVIDEQTGSSQS
jgi:transcriptional regulator with XRE-family HTH domain